MNRIKNFLTLLIFILSPWLLFAQNGSIPAEHNEHSGFAPRKLVISCNKTTMLIFPAAIQSADRGAGYVLAERVQGSENALKVKAGVAGFEPSSLTVVTDDGRVYAFMVTYGKEPSYLVRDFREAAAIVSVTDPVRFQGQQLNAAELEACALEIKGSPAFIKRVQANKYGINARLESIYTYKDVIFLKFRLHNVTAISYALSSIEFFIRDLKKVKRTAMQDNQLGALFKQSWGEPEEPDGQVLVLALPRFTIADDKKLSIELREKNGDRALSLELRERRLRKAKLFYHQ